MGNAISLALLKSARDILEPDGAWIKYESARNVDKEVVNVHDEDAVCFCAYGAMNRADLNMRADLESYRESCRLLSLAMNGSIASTNDDLHTEHIHVLMSYDFAILMAEDELK